LAEKHAEGDNAKSLLELWLKTSTDFWASMKEWDGNDSTPTQSDSEDAREKSRAEEAMQSTMRAVQAFAASMVEPEVAESWAKGINALPEVLLKIWQPLCSSFFLAQQEWMKKAGRVAQFATEHGLNGFSGNSFKGLAEIYEREFRQFFNMPPVGLTRGYQENINAAVDRYNLFQASMGEFLSLLYLPVEQSLEMMQDRLAEMTDSGKLPYDSREYYRMWIEMLENHYANLFKSPEYLETFGRTLNSVNDFIIARSQILQDALKLFPVPTQQDMDELYKEIYLLKKKIRNLEKRIPESADSGA